jgi:hypothetical protein
MTTLYRQHDQSAYGLSLSSKAYSLISSMRCQNVDFRRKGESKMVTRLRTIVREEEGAHTGYRYVTSKKSETPHCF